MTYTKPEIDTCPLGEDIEVMARRIEAAAQQQVVVDIDQRKFSNKR